MNIEQKIKEHNKLILQYKKKIKKYENLLKDQICRFGSIREKIEEKYIQDKYKRALACLKERPYILIVEFDKLFSRLRHSRVIEIIDIEVEMSYVGYHRVDKEYNIIEETKEINLHRYTIGSIDLNGAPCTKNQVINCLREYHNFSKIDIIYEMYEIPDEEMNEMDEILREIIVRDIKDEERYNIVSTEMMERSTYEEDNVDIDCGRWNGYITVHFIKRK